MFLRKVVQDVLLGPSQIFNSPEWLEKHWFRNLKRSCYFAYKNFYEREFINFVSNNKNLLAHGHIIDVGANIGFTVKLFSQHVSPPFSVYAFEPEKWNFKILQESVTNNGLKNIKIFPYALAESDSHKTLWVNPKNSADHRIVGDNHSHAENETLDIVTKNFDTFWEHEGFERISLIKMDIQGYELFALQGMQKSLQKYRPAILIELDNRLLQEHGHTVDDLYALLSTLNYTAHAIDASGKLLALSKTEVDEILKVHGYKDFVFLKKN